MDQVIPTCGPTYLDAGQVGPCLTPLQYKSRNFLENYVSFIFFLRINMSRKVNSDIKLRIMNAKNCHGI